MTLLFKQSYIYGSYYLSDYSFSHSSTISSTSFDYLRLDADGAKLRDNYNVYDPPELNILFLGMIYDWFESFSFPVLSQFNIDEKAFGSETSFRAC